MSWSMSTDFTYGAKLDAKSLPLRHIVGLSGGKDSTALAVRLAEVEPDKKYEYIITPTGDELDEMTEHWRYLSENILKTPLTVVSSGKSLKGLIRQFKALPNFQQRWCTRMLKIIPFENFLYTAAPGVAYIGLRADEEDREGGVYGHIEGVEQRFPLREWGWTVVEVMGYLMSKGIKIPERTDCARCYHQRLIEWWRLWKNHPDIWEDAKHDEVMTGHTFRSPKRDTWPASLAEMEVLFKQGRVPRTRASNQGGVCRVCSF